LDRFDRALRQTFQADTESCIAPKTLRLYALNQLSRQETQRVALHLAFCGCCMRTYRQSRIFRLEQLKQGVGHGVTEAREIWTALRAWFQGALTTRFEAEPLGTRGALGTAPVLQAFALNQAGERVGETFPLPLKQAPRITKNRLRFVATVTHHRHQNAQARVSLSQDDVTLDLGGVPVVAGRLEAQIDLDGFAAGDGVVPAALLQITFPKSDGA